MCWSAMFMLCSVFKVSATNLLYLVDILCICMLYTWVNGSVFECVEVCLVYFSVMYVGVFCVFANNLEKCSWCICHGCYPTDLSVIAPPPPSEGFLCHLLLILILFLLILIFSLRLIFSWHNCIALFVIDDIIESFSFQLMCPPLLLDTKKLSPKSSSTLP